MVTETPRSIYNPIQRDRVTFLKTSAETGGELTLVEVELSPGGGTPLHYHRSYDERFTAITGELGLQVGNEQRALRPGESALVERGVLHRFYNATPQPVRFYGEILPGQVGFEQSLYINYGLARDGKVSAGGAPKGLLTLALLVVLSDTRFPGRLALLNPAFGLLARIARWRGVESALLARYAPHLLGR